MTGVLSPHGTPIELQALKLALVVALAACDIKGEAPTTDPDPANGAIRDTAHRSAGPAPKLCGTTLVSGSGVGELRIGMSVASVEDACRVTRDTTRLASEGQSARFISIEFPSDTVEAEVVDGKVWRIEVTSTRFRTADSVGVGTPLSRLLTLRDPRGLAGEGRLFVVSPDHCGLSFRLSNNGADSRSQNWDRSGLSRLPPGTVVNKVLILGCDSR